MGFTSVIIFFIIEILCTVECSVGDRSIVYQKCLGLCVRDNCLEAMIHLQDVDTKQVSKSLILKARLRTANTSDVVVIGFHTMYNGNELTCGDSRTTIPTHRVSFSHWARIQQDVWSLVLQWSCRDECCYHCMWHTVAQFEEAGYGEPKFHGKWPFTRVLGVQEPAAAISSVLNLAANAYMYRKIRREFPMRSSALAAFWHVFAFVCMNAWAWSTVFHMRDKPLTEFMDYACALSMVMGLFVAAVVRVFHRRRRLRAVVLVVPTLYFFAHVQYLHAGRVDYDYNMKVNVFFGVAGSLLWLAWSLQQYRSGRRHARAMLLFTGLNGAALSLELLDFPPLWRTWDAHALWHLATAPLPLLFYRFVIDDLRLLQSGQYEKLDIKQT